MITQEQLQKLQTLFREWREERWRNCLDGNNRLQPERESKLIAIIYSGIRKRAIHRMGFYDLTIDMTMGRLAVFLRENPQFEPPKCKCGGALWHRKICKVLDGYHADTIKKGHETQRKQYEERKSDDFFQMHQFVSGFARGLVEDGKEG